MSSRTLAIVLVTAMLFGGSVFAASAFTSAEMTRTASIDVVADSQGIITLTPGATSAVTTDADGAMTINAAGNASGLNVDGTFTYGDKAAPSTTNAFSITNGDTEKRTFTIAANNFTANQGNTGAVTYTIYDSTGAKLATVDSATDATFDLTAGSTAYVVLETDTTGLDKTADLSHDLVITA